MSRFTVVWLEEAVDDLADCWLNAADRMAVSNVANTIGRLLAKQPARRAVLLTENLMKVDLPPLRVYFCLHADDCRVEITNIVLIPDDR